MTYQITITESAEQDIKDAFLWYEDQKNELGLSFTKNIDKAILKIQKNPLTIQIRYNEIRVSFLKKFPYGIHFTIINDEIVIIGVYHTSKSPKKWRG
jgi:toxin ParE1/3/4